MTSVWIFSGSLVVLIHPFFSVLSTDKSDHHPLINTFFSAFLAFLNRTNSIYHFWDVAFCLTIPSPPPLASHYILPCPSFPFRFNEYTFPSLIPSISWHVSLGFCFPTIQMQKFLVSPSPSSCAHDRRQRNPQFRAEMIVS